MNGITYVYKINYNFELIVFILLCEKEQLGIKSAINLAQTYRYVQIHLHINYTIVSNIWFSPLLLRIACGNKYFPFTVFTDETEHLIGCAINVRGSLLFWFEGILHLRKTKNLSEKPWEVNKCSFNLDFKALEYELRVCYLQPSCYLIPPINTNPIEPLETH